MLKRGVGRPKKSSYKSNDRFGGMKKNPYVEGHKTRKKKKLERRNQGHYDHSMTRKLPKPRFRGRVNYDFLQYIRIVFKWAQEKYGLSRPQLELFLYLYPKGVFTKSEFLEFQTTIAMYQIKAFRDMLAEGWITMWRPKRGKESALYTLSYKAKTICNKMHKLCVGDEKMSEDPRHNPIAKKEEKTINAYYMNIIKKMNKDREQKKA